MAHNRADVRLWWRIHHRLYGADRITHALFDILVARLVLTWCPIGAGNRQRISGCRNRARVTKVQAPPVQPGGFFFFKCAVSTVYRKCLSAIRADPYRVAAPVVGVADEDRERAPRCNIADTQHITHTHKRSSGRHFLRASPSRLSTNERSAEHGTTTTGFLHVSERLRRNARA